SVGNKSDIASQHTLGVDSPLDTSGWGNSSPLEWCSEEDIEMGDLSSTEETSARLPSNLSANKDGRLFGTSITRTMSPPPDLASAPSPSFSSPSDDISTSSPLGQRASLPPPPAQRRPPSAPWAPWRHAPTEIAPGVMQSMSAQDEKSASLEEGEEGVSLEEGKVSGGQGSLGSFESVLMLLPPSPATPPLGSCTVADADDERSPGRLRRAPPEAAPAGHRGEGEGEGDSEREGDEERGSEKREEVFGSCADFAAASGFMPIAGFKPKMNLLEVAIEKELEEKRKEDEMNAPARLPTTGLLAVATQSEDAGSEECSGSPTASAEAVGCGTERVPEEEEWTDKDKGLGGVGVTGYGGSRSPAALVVPPTPPPRPPTLPTALSLSLSLSLSNSTSSPPPGSLSPASEAENTPGLSQSPAQSSARSSVHPPAQATAPLFAVSTPPEMSPAMSPATSAAMAKAVSPAGSSIPSTQSEGQAAAPLLPSPSPSAEVETLRPVPPLPSSDRTQDNAVMSEAAGSTVPECREQAETQDVACSEAEEVARPAAPAVSTPSPAPSPSPRDASMAIGAGAAPGGSPPPEGCQSRPSTPPTAATAAATASPEKKAPAAWAPKPSAHFHGGKPSGPARAQPARAPAWGMPLPLATPEPQHPALTGVKPPPLQVPLGCFATQSRAAPPRLALMPSMPSSSPLPPPLPPPPPLVLPVSSMSAPSQLVFTPPSPSGRSTSASPTSTRSSPLLVRPPLLPLGVLSGRDIGPSGPGIPLVWSWSDSTLSGCSRSAGRGGGFSSVSASVSSSGRGESPLVGIRFVGVEGVVVDGDSDRETLWEVAGRTAAGAGIRTSPSRCAVGRPGEEEAGGAAAAAAATASAAAMSAAAASAATVAAAVAAESSLEGGVGGRQGKRPRRYFFP
ncbi:unnamed protein product, partial [Laminaria digitata]